MWKNHVFALSVAASSAWFISLICPKLILSHPFVLLSIVFGLADGHHPQEPSALSHPA